MRIHISKPTFFTLAALSYVVVACVTQERRAVPRNGWWAGQGPVLPHDSFPAECKLCHVGDDWQTLVEGFEFDHEAETGVALEGSHAQAQCLRCHNDRGPASVFEMLGCVGCHEDVHLSQLGPRCDSCHDQWTWMPRGQFELHVASRCPLIGVHAATACRRCHPGAEIGRFLPVDTECVSCHVSDLKGANNPNHLGLGWVDRCDRCHQPTTWNAVELDTSASPGPPGRQGPLPPPGAGGSLLRRR